MRCPNINSPEWKALVEKHGVDKALDLYALNNFDIPNVIRQDLNPILDNGKYLMNNSAIRQVMESNPKVARKVLEHIKQNFPSVRININGLFDENGDWVAMEPGTRGMHARNALVSAVAFSNDVELETIPHEFAHEYIQMFWDTPLVRKAIAKHSEEELADQMGKFFIAKAEKGWFSNFIDDLMYAVRKVFGSPGVGEVLARDYFKGKKQGALSSGKGYVSFQKSSIFDSLLSSHRTRQRFNPNTLSTSDLSKFHTSVEQINRSYADVIIPRFSAGGQLNLDQFDAHIRGNIDKAIEAKLGLAKPNRSTEMSFNHVNIDDNLIIQLKNFIKNPDGTKNDAALTQLAMYLSGERNVFYSETELAHFDTLIKMHQALGLWLGDYTAKSSPSIIGYQVAIANRILTTPGKSVSKDSVVNEVNREVSEQLRDESPALEKLKEKLGEKLSKKISFGTKMEKAVAYLYDGFLLSKSLTGKNSSMFSDLFYGSLDTAGNELAELQNAIAIENAALDTISGISNWGTSDVRDRNISEYETYEIETDKGNLIPLTMSEAATLYLNLKQEDTAEAVRNKGFYLNEVIKGRPFKSDSVRKISNKAITDLINEFESDPDKMKYIQSIRNTMNLIYDKVNPTFIELNGYELPKHENFFPAYYGAASEETRKEKRHIENFKSAHARLGGDMPIRVGDSKSLTSSYAVASGMYAAYAIPVRNNRMILDQIRAEYSTNEKVTHRMKMWEGFLNKIEDPSLLYSSQGETALEQRVNELMSNFAVFVLGYNPAVVIKQTASYMLAQEFIDAKYLKEAGMGVGPLMIPKLGKFFKSLKRTSPNENLDVVRKLLPVEYRLDEENEVWKKILEYSPYLAHRSQGHSHRELSETIMGMNQGKGTIAIKIPGVAKPYTISMKRAMEGIRVMDTVTIMDIWSAAKLQADDQVDNGKLSVKKDSPEYWEHVALVTEEAVKRTQPTSDVIHRSALSSMSGTIPRVLTMFSSATQQQAKIMISRMMDYNNNPTSENARKLWSTSWRTMFMTGLYITAIDGLKTLVTHGFDDEEEVFNFTLYNTITNMAGYFHGLGTVVRMVMSRIDDQPWTAEMQHPIEALLGDLSDATASALKGDLSNAFKKALMSTMMVKGIPGYPVKTTWNLIENMNEPTEEDKAALKENPNYQNDSKALNQKYDQLKAGVTDAGQLKDLESEKRSEKSELRNSYL